MPRPKIDVYWRDRVKELTEQNPRMSSRKITERLEQTAAKLERTGCPSEKSVRNIMKEHRATGPEVRRLYDQVLWPESFGTPELPWESASVVLEAIRVAEAGRYSSGAEEPPRGEPYRPTVRMAQWIWRLALAEPGMHPLTQLGFSASLAAADSDTPEEAGKMHRDIEGCLLHGVSYARIAGMTVDEYMDDQAEVGREAARRERDMGYIQAQEPLRREREAGWAARRAKEEAIVARWEEGGFLES
jgi:hypothetical protein